MERNYVIDSTALGSLMDSAMLLIDMYVKSEDAEGLSRAEQAIQLTKARTRNLNVSPIKVSSAMGAFERTATLSRSMWPWHDTGESAMPKDGFRFLLHRRGHDRYIVDNAFWDYTCKMFSIVTFDGERAELKEEEVMNRYDLWALYHKLPKGYGEE